MRTNKVAVRNPRGKTHEGGLADRLTLEQSFKRVLMNCLLWEKEFYEDGVDVAERLYAMATELGQVNPARANELVVEARVENGLRHAPLLCAVALAKVGVLEKETVTAICDRPDQMTELLALYSDKNDGNIRPLANAIKNGIAAAFQQFNAYSLAKYNRAGDSIKLRDALFLCHPKGMNETQQQAFDQLAEGSLPTPDTWEVALSAATDKRSEWERLLSENKLGALAYIRNLRNMREAGVPVSMVRHGLKSINTHRIFPYQLVTAGVQAEEFKRELENLLAECVDVHDYRLSGRTAIVLDRSGSMGCHSQEEIRDNGLRACALGMVAAEMCDDHDIIYFGNGQRYYNSDAGCTLTHNAGSLRGYQICDTYLSCNVGWGTDLGGTVKTLQGQDYDRVIVITDEQSASRVGAAPAKHSYMMNVASYRNGVGYNNGWNHIDGFSSNILKYILAYESQED